MFLFTCSRCWLRVDNHFIWSFIGPVTFIIVVSFKICASVGSVFFWFFYRREALETVYRFSLHVCWQPLSSAFSDQFAWKESGPIIADTRTSVSTQLWNPMKSELLSSNNAELFGPLVSTREYSPSCNQEEKSFQAWRSFAQWENKGDDGEGWVGGEHGSNEWVGQTTITRVHCPTEDHDTSPANPGTQTSPSSLLNISCRVHRVRRKLTTHVQKRWEQTHGECPCRNMHVNESNGCINMQNHERSCMDSCTGFMCFIWQRSKRPENCGGWLLRDQACRGGGVFWGGSICSFLQSAS